MPHRVTLIPGDGVGPEITAVARDVLDATGVPIEWDVQPAGAAVAELEGTALPERVVASIRETGVALKGPTATATGGERSVNHRLREQLDLYAGVRPCLALPGAPTRFPGTNFVIVRMIREDLYAGIEYEADDPTAASIRELVARSGREPLPPDTGVSLKVLSTTAAERLARFAMAYTRSTGRRRLTVAHKATMQRATDGRFLSAVRSVAAEAPDLEVDDILVDTLCMSLVTRPQDFDILIMPLVYSDLVSDLGAGLIGGPGLAPSANLGDTAAVFETVHGTAARHAGRDRVNPLALVLSGALLLRHVGEVAAAIRVEAAVAHLVAYGHVLTYDLLRVAPGDPRAASTRAVGDRLVRLVAQDAPVLVGRPW